MKEYSKTLYIINRVLLIYIIAAPLIFININDGTKSFFGHIISPSLDIETFLVYSSLVAAIVGLYLDAKLKIKKARIYNLLS